MRTSLFLLTAGLAFLTADNFTSIADTLALIRFGGSLLADLGSELTDGLLIDTGNDDLVGSGNLALMKTLP